MPKLAYHPWRASHFGECHKLVVYDGSGLRRQLLEEKLTLLSGDYMVKKFQKGHWQRCMAVLIRDEEDFIFIKLAFDLTPQEIRGKRDWSRYHPIDTRTLKNLIPSSTREARPMAD